MELADNGPTHANLLKSRVDIESSTVVENRENFHLHYQTEAAFHHRQKVNIRRWLK